MISIGHRGAMGYEPENTLASIKKAIELKTDIIEFDVQKTIDNHLVLFHDRKLNRTSDSNGLLRKKTLAQLRQIKLEQGKRIPTLQEALHTINRQSVVNIELKQKGTAEPVYKILKKSIKKKQWKTSDFIVSTSIRSELLKFKQLNPNFKLSLIIRSHPLKWLAFSKKIKAYSVQVYRKYLTKSLIYRAHKNNIKVFVYTVNSVKSIEKFSRMGVDGITTNYPDRIK